MRAYLCSTESVCLSVYNHQLFISPQLIQSAGPNSFLVSPDRSQPVRCIKMLSREPPRASNMYAAHFQDVNVFYGIFCLWNSWRNKYFLFWFKSKVQSIVLEPSDLVVEAFFIYSKNPSDCGPHLWSSRELNFIFYFINLFYYLVYPFLNSILIF